MAGMKFDDEKTNFDLIDPWFHEDLARVLTFGALKYKPNNWQKVKNAKQRYTAALERHLNAYKKGEMIDPDSGLSHMAHIACNSMFLHYLNRMEMENESQRNTKNTESFRPA